MLLRSLAIASLVVAGSAIKYNTTSVRVTGKINLHLVPHTHDDVGWLKTVDEYYYGNQNQIQRAVVQNILNSMIKELAWNPDRKFIYVEQAFFGIFWDAADEQTRALLKQLVANKQLEFINGGYTMHDEANPTVELMLDQTTLGHRFISETFGEAAVPTCAWQIDPFGHSAAQGSLFSTPQGGFNAVFWMRSDYQDIAARDAAQTTEFIWAPSPSLGLNAATYAGILYGGYCTIGGIDMSIYSNDSPIMDDTTLEDYNVGQVVIGVIDAVMDALKKVPQGEPGGDGTQDIMLPLGCDFNYENSATWFANTDKLVHYLNQDGRVNALYSTPSIYAAAKLEAAAQKSYTLRTDDLFPYGFFPHGYLTGFFTSRPALKGYIRESSSLIQAAKQLQAILPGSTTGLSPANPLYHLEQEVAICTHHDSITGSSKAPVAYDYAKRLSGARAEADAFLSEAFSNLTGLLVGGSSDDDVNVFASCDLANATICPSLESGLPTVVLVYNQQPHAYINDFATPNSGKGFGVRIPVGFPAGVGSYSVFDSAGNPVEAQILPLSDADRSLRTNYYKWNHTVTVQWLAFQTGSIPPLGYVTFFLQPAASFQATIHTYESTISSSSSSSITNGNITITFDPATGLVQSYADALTGITTPLSNEFLFYNSSAGKRPDCKIEPNYCSQNSGAYIFRPNGLNNFTTQGNEAINVTFVTGPVVSEARQVFNAAWASQVVRLWQYQTSAVEFEWMIGPIPYSDGLGREVISRYSTNLQTNSTWYSDSNGRDSIQRILNYRSSWNYTVNEPIAANYYPTPGFVYATDIQTHASLSILPDRAEGSSSLADGQIELMLHRRLQFDDELGVGEPLNETGLDAEGEGLVVRGSHFLCLDTSPQGSKGAFVRRAALANMLWRPVVRFAVLPPSITTPQEWVTQYKTSFQALAADIPQTLHLLTVHKWNATQLLLRISHNFEANDPNGTITTVELNNIFNPVSSGVVLQYCIETTLPGSRPLSTTSSWTYNVTNGPVVTLPIIPFPPSGNEMSISIGPMQIRSFLCNIGASQ